MITEESLFGNGNGIDHVMLCVRDLSTSSQDYSHALGFETENFGKFPNYGLKNAGSSFPNQTYLELIACYDRSRGKGFVTFIDKHEGVMAAGLDVSSATETASFLRKRNFEIEGPTEGIKFSSDLIGDIQTPMWNTLEFKEGSVEYLDRFFFIQYNANIFSNQRFSRVHANSAESLASVWLAVKDLGRASKEFERAGFQAIRDAVNLDQLGGMGKVYGAVRGSILVIQPEESQTGAVTEFLKKRDDESAGIMGLSIQVSDIEKARNILETGTRTNLPVHEGLFGKSVLMSSSELTHGMWIEFFQS